MTEPQSKPTMQMPAAKAAELDAEMVKHEAKRVAEWLGQVDAKLDGLATKGDIEEIRGGIGMALAGIESLARSVADIKAAIDGEGGLAQKIDGIHQGVGGALKGVAEAKQLARASYHGIFHGPGSVSHEERTACEAIG